MAAIPEIWIVRRKDLSVIRCFGKTNQKIDRAGQSMIIPVNANAFPVLGCPLIAFSFSRLHQKLFVQLKPMEVLSVSDPPGYKTAAMI